MADINGRVRREDGGTIRDDSTIDGAGDGDRASRRTTLAPGLANACHHGNEGGGRNVRGEFVIAEDDGDMRRAWEQEQDRVGYLDENLIEILRGHNPLLRGIQRRQGAGVAFDLRGRRCELVEASHREDVRLVRVLGYGHTQRRRRVPRAELDHIPGLEVRGARVDRETSALAAMHECCAVGRPKVVENHATGVADDSSMLGRDMRVIENDVVPRSPPQGNDLLGELERAPRGHSLRDFEEQHPSYPASKGSGVQNHGSHGRPGRGQGPRSATHPTTH